MTAAVAIEPCRNCAGKGYVVHRTSCNCSRGGHVTKPTCRVCQGTGERVQKCRRCSGRRRLVVRDYSTGTTYEVKCGACRGRT
jgi:DnaJ-class molecular chaperone